MTEYRDEMHAGLMARLEERRQLAEGYYAKTRALADALGGDEYDRVSACVDARAELAAAIDGLSRALEVPMRAYTAYRDRAPAGDARVQEAEAALAQTREIFEAVQALDRGNMAALRGLMGAAAEEGKKLTKSREGIGKYAQKDLIFTPGIFDAHQ